MHQATQRITCDKEKEMGLNFDLTVERGKVALTVSLIKPCKATKLNPKIKKALYPKKKKNIKSRKPYL